MLTSQITSTPIIEHHPKILVVDDLRENHRVFNSILRDLDASIYSANSGEDALSLVMRHQFSVILLDVMMPGMDGFETANLIRINEDSKLTPIIFVTAMEPNDDYEIKGYDAGAVDYLFKPIKPLALTGKVKVFIELERQRAKIKQTLVDIQKLENRNELLLKSVGEGILGLDQTGHITFSNPAAQSLLGFKENEIENKSFISFISNTSNTDDTSWEQSSIFKRCNKGLGHHKKLGYFRKANGTPFPVEYLATPIRDFYNSSFIGVVIAFKDVTERKRTEDQLARLAQIDTLTGLNNRYAFNKQINQSIARAKRLKNPLVLLFIDLDKFKQVNDSLGHKAGDDLLKEFSQRLLACMRDGDVLSRLGGDEFTAILESAQGGRSAAVVAEKILNELKLPFTVFGNEIYISASIGIAVFPESGYNGETLLRSADIAMYKAKQLGRNTYQFFTDTMQRDVSNEMILENALRSALKNNEFELYYQPKVNPKSLNVEGMEALIRWNNNQGEMVNPAQFIPKAEEMGLITDIGLWVLRKGCEQTLSWIKSGILDKEITIAINLSMKQLVNQDLPKTVGNVLQQTGLPAQNLELEITESMMMKDPETTIKIIQELSNLGIKITIDDFGTGYSSLSYLSQLPIDCLKIDKSFIQSLGNENNDVIVKAIIGLGQNMELKIVAEGVETQEQLLFLQQHRIDLIQGYFYSPPINSEQFENYINKLKQ